MELIPGVVSNCPEARRELRMHLGKFAGEKLVDDLLLVNPSLMHLLLLERPPKSLSADVRRKLKPLLEYCSRVRTQLAELSRAERKALTQSLEIELTNRGRNRELVAERLAPLRRESELAIPRAVPKRGDCIAKLADDLSIVVGALSALLSKSKGPGRPREKAREYLAVLTARTLKRAGVRPTKSRGGQFEKILKVVLQEAGMYLPSDLTRLVRAGIDGASEPNADRNLLR